MLFERGLTGTAGRARMERPERLLSLGRPLRAVGRRGKADADRQEHRPGGHVAGRLEIPLDKDGRHGHRLADVRETLAPDGIGWKLPGLRRPEVDAREVAHRVVVFGVGQPPERHRPGVPCPFGRLGIERRQEPRHHLLALGLGRLRRLARGHVAGADPLDNVLEHRRLGEKRVRRGVAREDQLVVLRYLAVARAAGAGDERHDALAVRLPQFDVSRGKRRWHAGDADNRDDPEPSRSHPRLSTPGRGEIYALFRRIPHRAGTVDSFFPRTRVVCGRCASFGESGRVVHGPPSDVRPAKENGRRWR